MSDQRTFLGKTLELLVFAPAGVARKLRDDLPGLVESGRREVENRVRVAHWVGEMAVAYGMSALNGQTPEAPSEDSPDVELAAPFGGYDELPALELVQLLDKLPVAELRVIQQYETQTRARRTVLAKIDQLIDA